MDHDSPLMNESRMAPMNSSGGQNRLVKLIPTVLGSFQLSMDT
jgi:hypothetical protein